MPRRFLQKCRLQLLLEYFFFPFKFIFSLIKYRSVKHSFQSIQNLQIFFFFLFFLFFFKFVFNVKKKTKVCNHPFICTLHATYSDKDLLYMLLECVKGGELFQLLRTNPGHRLPLSSCQFYAACVVDALVSKYQ